MVVGATVVVLTFVDEVEATTSAMGVPDEHAAPRLIDARTRHGAFHERNAARADDIDNTRVA